MTAIPPTGSAAVSNPASTPALNRLAVLAAPIRKQLYEAISASEHPLSREQAAARVNIAEHTAKHHLEKLVEAGVLATEFRRLSGRTGPGAGRPAKLYRLAYEELAVSVPPRQYSLLSRILANAVATATAQNRSATQVARELAHHEGIRLGQGAHPSGATELEQVTATLATVGYEPAVNSEGVVQLHNCPFHQAASEQVELVCGMNLEFIEGVCHGMATTRTQADLTPMQGKCCVSLRDTASTPTFHPRG